MGFTTVQIPATLQKNANVLILVILPEQLL
jgi:hypothetical protein